jgi:hypothetical protein
LNERGRKTIVPAVRKLLRRVLIAPGARFDALFDYPRW